MTASEARKHRQRSLAKLNAECVEANLDAPLSPRTASGDNNVHHVYLEADPQPEGF